MSQDLMTIAVTTVASHAKQVDIDDLDGMDFDALTPILFEAVMGVLPDSVVQSKQVYRETKDFEAALDVFRANVRAAAIEALNRYAKRPNLHN